MINYLQTISMISARQLLLSIVAITIGTALPGPAQQNGMQDLKAAAAAAIAERSELYNKKDAGGSRQSSRKTRPLSSFCPDSR